MEFLQNDQHLFFKSIYRRGISFVGVEKVWDDLIDSGPKKDLLESSPGKDWLLDSGKSRRQIFKCREMVLFEFLFKESSKWACVKENANEMISVYNYESVVV